VAEERGWSSFGRERVGQIQTVTDSGLRVDQMLFLLFKLGSDRYALEASHVVEVLPLLELRQLPHAPKGFAGIFNSRGRPVPAVDLCEITLGFPARERLSTRIILIDCQVEDGSQHLLGLIAEEATEMLRKDPREFVDPGVRMGAAPYLGPVLMDPKGPIQWVHEQHLLPDGVRALLVKERGQLVKGSTSAAS
jgi:chemotaxis-related protein WspB